MFINFSNICNNWHIFSLPVVKPKSKFQIVKPSHGLSRSLFFSYFTVLPYCSNPIEFFDQFFFSPLDDLGVGVGSAVSQAVQHLNHA